ncbi:MAG: MBG domain-containing protein [Paludibacteraceae bacterium]|nr:MBG domain-containing protein [Paludibacteraceae bacterium]
MRKLFLFITALTLCAGLWAQTIDAVKVTQNGTTDWYRFGESSRIDVIIDDLGNPEFPDGTMYDLTDGNVETEFGTAPAEKITLTAADFVIKDNNVTYNGDAQKVSVGMADESKIMPPADIMTIYYDNNESVKQLTDAGVYQVYIDIKGNDTYNAVKGLTSNAWKLTIAKATLTASDFTYIAPADLTWDGNAKTATVTFNDQNGKLTGCGEVTVKYNGSTETPSAVGDYVVTIDVAEGANYNAATELTDEDWQFTIEAPVDTWITVRTDGAANNWNTICLERNITAIDGATFWTIVGQDATSFILDEVTEPEAGQGYLIRFTKSDLKVKYGEQVAATPVPASYDNPVQGTFTQIDFDEQGKNVLVGNYVVYNNQLCMVEGYVGMYAHRAYVVANLVPNNAPAQAPGRARAYMPKPKQTPTGLNRFTDSPTPRFTKYIKDGQLVIVKDGKKRNALGM